MARKKGPTKVRSATKEARRRRIRVLQRMIKGEDFRAIAKAEGVTYAAVIFDAKQMRKDFGAKTNFELMYRLGLRDGYRRALAEIGAGKYEPPTLQIYGASRTITVMASNGSEQT